MTLPKLVDSGFLVSSGEKRDKSYSLPGMEPPSPEDVFANALSLTSSLTHREDDLTHSAEALEHRHEDRDEKGRFISELLDKPYIDNLSELSEDFRHYLETLTLPSRTQRRLSNEMMRSILEILCDGHYLAVSAMEILLERKAQSIRQNYLKPMVDEKTLKLAFPNKPNSPKQGYSRR